MASNSDSIFNLLSFLKRHPDHYKLLDTSYDNAVRLCIPDNVKVSEQEIYFPDNKLMVNRMQDDFSAQHGDLLEYYQAKTNHPAAPFKDVWITTAHIPHEKSYLLEISYE
ncbi:hypothetical protein [Liquorilactobacillus capillatus]|uniref:Uncharacterized protein n=1 Tax=Liquorilactobacillus capillatus DSM 19910 TaxID=1423731 RepID=A0A0R1M357_9LACO|nr:hypothetical protein [Liquorilactobacillus capillatus]KRL00148.1 hypothetical protein FC81_GL000526 [Liquorilactobacillus capillatus DSM 19910]